MAIFQRMARSAMGAPLTAHASIKPLTIHQWWTVHQIKLNHKKMVQVLPFFGSFRKTNKIKLPKTGERMVKPFFGGFRKPQQNQARQNGRALESKTCAQENGSQINAIHFWMLFFGVFGVPKGYSPMADTQGGAR